MIAADEVNDFADAIERRFGHGQDNGRYHDLGNLLEARVQATASQTYSAYRALLAHSDDEWSALAPLLTVPETYFFRLPDQLDAFAGTVIPTLIRARESERTLRILSAGCASGEEPYSLRILLNEHFPQLAAPGAGWKIQIDAFDLSEPALARARAANYTDWSLRATSPERRRAHFVPAGPGGKLLHLLPAAREGVTFFCRNLLERATASEIPYDVIFCRNVLIYLSPQAIDRAITRLTEQLAPGGYLFLGPAESLRGLTRNFVLCQSHDAFYYRRRDRVTIVDAADDPATPSPSRRKPAQAASRSELQWFDAIQRSSERLAQLMAPTSAASSPALNAKAAPPAKFSRRRVPASAKAEETLSRTLACFRSDDFAQALTQLDAAAKSERDQPAARLLRAAALTQLGRYDDAQRECTLLLAADDRNAGAHFLFGLCREQAGELPEAEEHMRQASYLDPGFALPQLHLGLLARRRHDMRAARRALERALRALRLEDETRIALFAGSLTRESLVLLCERELRRPDHAA